MSRIADNSVGLSRLVWTSCIIAGASLPHWTALPAWIPLLLIGAVTWRFGARLLRWPLPKRWMIWIITIIAFAAVLFEYRTVNGLMPGTALLIVMVALKFLETRTHRDHIMLTVIAYFIVFASVLAGGSIIKGLYLVGFVWITTLGLLQVGRRGPLLGNRATARLASRVLIQAAPMMVVLFLLFPRLPGPLWALPGDTSSGATGLSGSMSPGDITNLGLSDEIAFRVDFAGQPPATADLYWRGPVLATFDGRTWTPREGMVRRAEDTLEFLGDSSEYRVMLDPNARNWAFALEMPQTWTTNDRRNLFMGSDYMLRLPFGGSGGRVSYSVTSYSRYRAMDPLSNNELEYFTRLPAGLNPRTRELVDGMLTDDPDARTIIDRGLDVFRQTGFFYTLTPPPLGEHSADDFIFGTREGFCEHYASAFAIMMRMAGMPTRVVTGYQGGELNEIGEYYIIRQSNAHAWTEIWLPGEGWTRVDPISAVAPERIALGSGRAGPGGASGIGQIRRLAWLRQAALAWDAVNTFWNEWIVGYGPRLQRSLLEKLGFERPRWRELMMMTVIATVIMMVGLTVYLGMRAHRWQPRDPAAECFLRFNRKLKRLHVEPIRRGETPTGYARRAAVSLPAAADTIWQVTSDYLAARYEPDRSGRALARLRGSVRGFRPRYARASN